MSFHTITQGGVLGPSVRSRPRLVRAFGATALALGLITSTAPASATDDVTLAGTATMTPGLSPSGCVPQRLTFDGTITVTSTTTRVVPVRFEGTSSGCETADAGAGTGAFSGGLTGTATYVRSGDVIMLYGAEALVARIRELIKRLGSVCVYTPVGRVCVVW